LQKYGILNEKNYIAPMKKKVKRIIYMILIAVILFSASMSIPMLYNSKWRDFVQGAAIGLMLAACVIIIATIIDYFKESKTSN
jgi:membrane protein YdbS with pleckstrin-like domain